MSDEGVGYVCNNLAKLFRCYLRFAHAVSLRNLVREYEHTVWFDCPLDDEGAVPLLDLLDGRLVLGVVDEDDAVRASL